MNYIQYMKPGSKFWALPNGLEDVSWSEFWSNWKKAITKAKEQFVDNWENLKQDYKDAADPVAASKRKQAESIEATKAKQASMKFVSDNRIDYEKKRDRKNFELKEFEQKEQLNKDATDAVMWTLTGPVYAVLHLASPDGLVKTVGNTRAAIQNGGGPYLEKAVASAAGDVLDATILAAPLFTTKARLARAMNENIKQGIQLGLYYHGSPNRNISRFKIGKDGGVYFTQNRNAAKLYTGTFGTGKVYNADLDLGNKTITIDNGGAAWTKIPENKVAEAFNLTPLQVHDIIGSYNLGEVPWHYGFTKMFGYKPKNNYYAIDQVVKLGKDLGISSLIINNAKDNGKRLFSRTLPYDLTVVYNPKQIILGGQTPNLKLYGSWSNFNNGLIRLGYTTSGIKQTGTPTGNFHWREDITDIDNPILLDIKPDMHYTRTRTTPVIKEVTNVDDILLRTGIVPISNNPVLAVEQITVNPVNRLVKVGERVDLTLSPNRVVQFEYQPRLVDNKGRLVSSDANRYFGIPTKTETLYTLWHKSGGPIKIKKKNIGSFTRYCNGKVTEECIRKGKNSSNPTTRKRANFAWVARHKFKHEEGGKINYLNIF